MNEEQFLDLMEVLVRVAKALEAWTPKAAAADSDAWRSDSASDKQKAFLSKNKIPFTEPLTKGEASDLIDGYLRNKRGS